MKTKYFYIITVFFVFFSVGLAQSLPQQKAKDSQIVGLEIYPNPVTNKQVVVTTSSNEAKQIELFDLLGKKVYTTQTEGERIVLQLDNFKPGVYFIRITEKELTVTRKLVIK